MPICAELTFYVDNTPKNSYNLPKIASKFFSLPIPRPSFTLPKVPFSILSLQSLLSPHPPPKRKVRKVHLYCAAFRTGLISFVGFCL